MGEEVEVEVEAVLMNVGLVLPLCRFGFVLVRVSSSVLEAVAFDNRMQRLRTACCRLARHAYAFPGSCWYLDNFIAVTSHVRRPKGETSSID